MKYIYICKHLEPFIVIHITTESYMSKRLGMNNALKNSAKQHRLIHYHIILSFNGFFSLDL